MQIQEIDPKRVIEEFQKEFGAELKKFKRKISFPYSDIPLLEMVPGYRLFETDLDSLLDVYDLLVRSGKDSIVPLEWQVPYQELAVISFHSVSFLSEIKNKELFINQLFRKGRSFIENPYPAMRFQLVTAWHLKNYGNNVAPKFLDTHEDFDILVTTPQGIEVEIECKIQSEESGQRVEKIAVEEMAGVLRKIAYSMQCRVQIVIECNSDVRPPDVSKISSILQGKIGTERKFSFQQKINGKEFQVSVKTIGALSEKISPREIEVLLSPFKEHYRIGIWGTHRPDEQKEEGFSFVAVKSAKSNRPLTNLLKSFGSSAKYQFSGTRPAVVAIHLDSDTEIEKIVNLDNFREAFAGGFTNYPNVSALAFSSMDIKQPSGVGYPFGRLILFHNHSAHKPTKGLHIPGLTIEST